MSMAIGGLILLLTQQVVLSSSKWQTREQLTVPVQESVRGAMEVMSTELREAISPRVLSSYTSPPTALSAAVSTNSSVTMLVGDLSSTFALAKPAGYPTLPGYPAQAVLNVTTPNEAGLQCGAQLKAGDYVLLLSQPQMTPTTLNISWSQVALAATGCLGSIPTTSVAPVVAQWTVDSRVYKAKITQYYTGVLDGTNVLYRRILGATSGTPQVVAFDITGLVVEYTSDGITFTPTPSSTAEPLALRITLTGKSSQTGPGNTTLNPYTVSQVVFMRQTTLVKPF